MRLLFLLFIALPFAVLAERPANLEPLPDDAPPPPDYGANAPPSPGMSQDVPATEPEVTIVERDSATFEEYRVNGRLYKIKVTPKIGPPYYLIDDQGANVWRRYDSMDSGLQVPRWDILEF
ncbi:MAG: DUF2782 domain-containing protein [Betaproteobacteria bacterium]|nr:DUF2782 domain-containing protein [Betaproteobacteria bacterium]